MDAKRTVMLVDDDENLLIGLKRALRKEPYEVVTADGPLVALRMLGERPIDVVVSDNRMPKMSGTEFVTEVKRLLPDTVRIMLTGQADLDAALAAINGGGIYRFFTKPCDPTQLATAIRQALQHRELLLQGRRLLRTVQRQADVLGELESRNPGITKLHQTDDGSIIIDDDGPTDLDGFLAEASRCLDKVGAAV